jgi:hypothetical protein
MSGYQDSGCHRSALYPRAHAATPSARLSRPPSSPSERPATCKQAGRLTAGSQPPHRCQARTKLAPLTSGGCGQSSLASRWLDVRADGAAYADPAIKLRTARGTDGYEAVWFYQRLSDACATHGRRLPFQSGCQLCASRSRPNYPPAGSCGLPSRSSHWFAARRARD